MGLTKTERVVMVFNIIQEYLEKERAFSSKDVLPYVHSCISKSPIDINRQGIKEAIKALVEKNILVEQSKIISKDVLSNKNRSLVFSLVNTIPGINFSKLIEKTNLSIPVVTWHLNILEKFHFIDSGKEGKQKIYYPRGFSYDDAKLLNLINRKKCSKILKECLTSEKSLSINKLSKKISVSRKAVSNYIEKLMTFNLIEMQTHSYYPVYSLNKSLFRDFIENFKEFEDIRPWLTLLK